MADHFCRGSDSAYTPVCCVHEHEGQPLLGHHAHSRPQAAQQQQPPYYEKGDYHIDMNDSTSHHQSFSNDNRRCSKSRRRKLWLSFSLIALYFVGWMFFHSKTHGKMYNGFDAVNYDSTLNDYCKERAIKWDGVTDLSTKAKHFKLYFGKGNLASHVQVKTGQVSEPTLRIAGKVSPWGEDRGEDRAVMKAHGSETEYTRLGLHILIKDDDDQFDASLWFEDREVHDEHDGQRYRACARLEVEVVFPQTYTGYDSLTIGGHVVSVEGHGLGSIGFQKLDLGASVGEVVTRDTILTNQFRAHVDTGKISVEAIRVATEGNALDVDASTATGAISVGAEPTMVENNAPHNINIASNTGSIQLDVRQFSQSRAAPNPGSLKIHAHTNTGSVKTSVQLADAEQVLLLNAYTNTGTVSTVISDTFLGHFTVQTRVGSAKVETARGSKSIISFEKSTPFLKSGTKTLSERRGDDQSKIELSTGVGVASLKFI
ncbi:hypothetical protein BGZ75_001368 [Mortierella antarctica]|nr:hypothetical protein BGZ75_001368 [Mortierella antarctica]